MALLIRLAVRNILRNKRRSMITICAISLGLALIVWTVNLGYGSYQSMVEGGIRSVAGHVVVQGAGYQAEKDPKIRVANASDIVETIRQTLPDARVTSRIVAQGLLTSPDNSAGVAVFAIDPVVEPEISDWQDKLTDGEWFDGDRGILIGVKLAETLQVELGDKVVMMAQGGEDMSSRLFRVRGIFRTGSPEMDGFFSLVTVSAAQELLEMPDAVSQISVHIENPDDTPATLATVQAGVSDDSLEILDWKGALPELVSMIQIDRNSNNAILSVIGFIVALGVLNTMLMSVLERVREFGVLLAIGLSPGMIARMIILEGLMLGLISALIGLALGLLLTWPMMEYGLNLEDLMGSNIDMAGVTMDAIIYSELDVERVVAFTVMAVVLSVLATLYPAWKATRLQPVEAMRHV